VIPEWPIVLAKRARDSLMLERGVSLLTKPVA